jgi:hypothetical protein
VNGIVEEEQDEDAALVAAELCHFQLSKVMNGSVVANGVVVNWGCCKWSSCEWYSCNWVIANGVVANGMVANGGEDGNNYGGFFFWQHFCGICFTKGGPPCSKSGLFFPAFS